MSYVAQTEREFIRQRQAEGIAAAKERGVRFGPERLPMPEGFEELAEDWWKGYITATEAGKQLGISRKTFTRRAQEWGEASGFTKLLKNMDNPQVLGKPAFSKRQLHHI